MGEIKTYRDLLVWQKSMNLVTDLYKTTIALPSHEQHGLTSQIRRSSVSVPSNIAEGYCRRSTGEYKRFLQIALGSLYELQTQLEIVRNLQYIADNVYLKLFDNSRELERMLCSLVSKIK